MVRIPVGLSLLFHVVVQLCHYAVDAAIICPQRVHQNIMNSILHSIRSDDHNMRRWKMLLVVQRDCLQATTNIPFHKDLKRGFNQ